LTFNPSFDAKIIERALKDDPERFSAEYLCQWRDDLSSRIGRDLLDASVDPNVIVRPPETGKTYFGGADASGGRNDSFTGAIAHRENDGLVYLDALFERKAPSNPIEVVKELADLMTQYRCNSVVGDNYAAGWVVESFGKVGKTYIRSEQDRSAVYLSTLPLLTSGQVRLLDNSRMLSQFAALERRTFSTGRERVDPGPGHDDLCNAAALALVSASKDGGGMGLYLRAYLPGYAESQDCKALEARAAQTGRTTPTAARPSVHVDQARYVPQPQQVVPPRDENGDPPSIIQF
jgi:hypothetical protein